MLARGNRIVIEGRAYDAKVRGGGRFDVFTAAGTQVGSFTVRGRSLEAEDLGIAGADPVEEIGLLWMRQNLSVAPEPRKADPPPPSPATAAAPPAVTAPPAANVDLAAPQVAAEPAIAAPSTRAAAGPSEAPPVGTSALRPSVAPSAITWSLCRLVHHNRPDHGTLKKGVAYSAWLRSQPGVRAAYLTHDASSGKTISISIWETREALNALKQAQPPADAVPLDAVKTEYLWVVG